MHKKEFFLDLFLVITSSLLFTPWVEGRNALLHRNPQLQNNTGGNSWAFSPQAAVIDQDGTIQLPLLFQDNVVASSWWQGFGLSAPLNQTFDAALGFELRFTYLQTGPYGNQNLPGLGFVAGLHSGPHSFIPPVRPSANPRTLGFRETVGGIGLALEWQSTNNVTMSLISTNDIAMTFTFNTLPVVWNDGNPHVVQLNYNGFLNRLMAYHDDLLVFSINIDLSNFFIGSQQVFGFTSEFGVATRQTNLFVPNQQSDIIVSLENLDPMVDRLWLSCPAWVSINIGNAGPLIPDDILPTPINSEIDFFRTRGFGADDGYSLPIFPAEVIGIVATPDVFGNIGITAELRNPEFGYPVNLNGQWQCSTQDPLDDLWRFGPPSDPSIFFPAAVLSDNAIDGTFHQHYPLISERVQTIWAQDLSPSTVWCRAEVPRFCSAANPIEMSNCFGPNEICVENNCFCPFPFEGDLCDMVVRPVLDTLTPNAVPLNTTVNIILQGSNIFSNPELSCVINGATTIPVVASDMNSVTCQLPPQATTGTLTLQIRNINGGMLSINSETVTVIDIAAFAADTIVALVNNEPSVGMGPINPAPTFTVTGAFLNLPVTYTVNFPPETPEIPCTFLSPTQLSCGRTPSHVPGVVTPVLTIGEFFQLPILGNYTFFDGSTSTFCRDFAILNPGNEFPFVTPVELSGQGEVGHFPRNIAPLATVSSSIMSGGLGQLIDNDFCCEIVQGNLGILCGLFFPLSANEERITLEFGSTPVFINEIVTSWRSPCLYMPETYDIYYRNAAGAFQFIETRSTVGDTSCASFPGDSEPVGLCIDYFPVVQTTAVQIRFDNTAVNLPVTSPGAWNYEVAAFGVPVNDPLRIQSIQTSLGNLGGSTNVILPTLDLSITNFAGTPLVSPLPLFVQLFTASGLDVTDALLGIPEDNGAPYSPGVYNNLFLINPPIDDYFLNIFSPGLTNLTLSLSVTTGNPTEIIVNPPPGFGSSTADRELELDTIQVCLQDGIGSLVLQPLSIFASSDTLTFSGATSATTINGCASFVLTLLSPRVGFHTLTFSSGLLQGEPLGLTITPGSPALLVPAQPIIPYDNAGPFMLRMQVADRAGNPLTAGFGGTRATISNITPFAVATGLNTTIASGEAVFPELFFQGIHGTAYTLTVTTDNTLIPLTTAIVQVLNCSQIFTGSVPDDLGLVCQCAPGFFSETSGNAQICLPCAVNTFKAAVGDGQCTPCPQSFDTFGQLGSTECVCDRNTFLNAETGICEACPKGALCGGNNVIGNLAGYWSSEGTSFYPCHLAENNPNPNNENIAQEACPQATGFPTSCGEGYNGVRCLECEGDFGPNETGACRNCPSQGEIWGVNHISLFSS